MNTIELCLKCYLNFKIKQNTLKTEINWILSELYRKVPFSACAEIQVQ